MTKLVVILRGVPGSGKSFYVNQNYPDATVCSADHYMVDTYGDYKFDPKKLGHAHGACFGKFTNALEKEHSIVVLDNTNIKKLWFKEYVDTALEYGYNIKIIRLICDPKIAYSRNQHNVPYDTIENGYKSLISQDLMENEVIIRIS